MHTGSFQGITADSQEAVLRAFHAAWRKPLPDSPGAVRATAVLSLGKRFDGSFGPTDAPMACLTCSPNEPEPPTCVVYVKIDRVGSAIWLEPPGIVVMGVTTLIGVSCRRHL